MYITPVVDFFIRNNFSIKDYEDIKEVLSNLDNMSSLDNLMNGLNDYLINVPAGQDNSDTKIGLLDLITVYCRTVVIPSNMNIIISPQASTVFISGLLTYINNIDTYVPVVSEEAASVLNSSEYEPEQVIGMLVNMYKPEYNITDAYDDIESISDIEISDQGVRVDRAINEAKEDPDGMSQLFSSIVNVDSSLVNTKLFKYINNNSNYNISPSEALGFINKLVPDGLVLSDLIKELLVLAIATNMTLDEIVDIVDTVYENYNTDEIVTVLRSKLGVI